MLLIGFLILAFQLVFLMLGTEPSTRFVQSKKPVDEQSISQVIIELFCKKHQERSILEKYYDEKSNKVLFCIKQARRESRSQKPPYNEVSQDVIKIGISIDLTEHDLMIIYIKDYKKLAHDLFNELKTFSWSFLEISDQQTEDPEPDTLDRQNEISYPPDDFKMVPLDIPCKYKV